MKALLALITTLAVLSGCDVKATSVQGSSPGAAYINSYDHEGHRFVTARNLDGAGGLCIIHSPACPCLKNEKRSQKE